MFSKFRRGEDLRTFLLALSFLNYLEIHFLSALLPGEVKLHMPPPFVLIFIKSRPQKYFSKFILRTEHLTGWSHSAR